MRRLAFGVVALCATALAVSPVGAADPHARALELERSLAATADPYLVLRVDPPAVEIRVRGVVLEEIPVLGATFLERRTPWERLPSATLALPLVWVVGESPESLVRRRIEPSILTPFDSEALARTTSGPDPENEPPRAEEIPASYLVPLSPAEPTPQGESWALEVAPRPRSTSFWSRPLRWVDAGWRRLWGEPPPADRLLSLTLEPEAARTLCYQLRRDTRLLVLPSDRKNPTE